MSTESSSSVFKTNFIKNQVSPLFKFPFSIFFFVCFVFVVDNLVIRLNNYVKYKEIDFFFAVDYF